MINRTIFYFIFIFLTACAQATDLTLIYSGNLDGELEPCGCSEEGDLGGLKRRVSVLDDLRKKHPELVAISAGGLIKGEGPGDEIKSDFILNGFQSFNYDAIGVQWGDLIYGQEQLTKYELQWVASNWRNKNINSSKNIQRTIGGEKLSIQFFSWLDPVSSPMKKMQGSHSLVENNHDELIKNIELAKKSGQLTVLATSVDLEKIQLLLPLTFVDILMVKSAYEEFSEPKKVKNTLVLQAGSRGMRIAKLNLTIKNGSISKWKHKIISMPSTIEDSPRMKDWYQEYNDKVKIDYLRRAEIKKKNQSGESQFVGEEQCQLCHVNQYKIWEASEHYKAFEDLEEVSKSFDPACLQCHTVGFNVDGGFIDIGITPNLMGVQCESCHGAGKEHVKSGGTKPAANKGWSKEQICAQCHTQPHSPSFSIEKYWPKIAH